MPILKKKLSSKYGVSTDQIIIGNGSDEIFLFITGAFIENGDTVLTSEGSFSEYAFAGLLYGARVQYVPMRDGKFQLPDIGKAADNRTKVIFLCNPNNPTGTYFTLQELHMFMKQISSETLVVLDEAYCEYADAPDYPDGVSLLSKYKNLLVLRTFSKIYGLAGLRVGYGIGDPEVISHMNKTRPPFNVNRAAQIAASAALDDETHLKASQQLNREERQFLYDNLTRLGYQPFPSQANFVFFFYPGDHNAVFTKMMDGGVTIRPLTVQGRSALRITCGTRVQNELCIRLLEEIG